MGGQLIVSTTASNALLALTPTTKNNTTLFSSTTYLNPNIVRGYLSQQLCTGQSRCGSTTFGRRAMKIATQTKKYYNGNLLELATLDLWADIKSALCRFTSSCFITFIAFTCSSSSRLEPYFTASHCWKMRTCCWL
ncbi:hypothetical protein J6590_029291 [Homalodisca vitripennis]|nr:hypothetical protein J6590_029291 [Homalodisca vitripennis]